MHKIGMKTGIRAVALVLIAFPEPVTTIIGISVLSATFFLWQQKRLSKFGDPEELIKISLKSEEQTGFRCYFSMDQAATPHKVKMDFPSQLKSVPGIPEKTPSDYQYNSWFDNRSLSKSIVHHTLKTSFPQYEIFPKADQNENPKTGIPKNNKSNVEYHPLRLSVIQN